MIILLDDWTLSRNIFCTLLGVKSLAETISACLRFHPLQKKIPIDSGVRSNGEEV
jgi:hypothetical protein